MTTDEMRAAGTYSEHMAFTNEQLDDAIKGMELALAFLEGKGVRFSLASNPLRKELEHLRTLQWERRHTQ